MTDVRAELKKVDLDKDFKESTKRLEELKKNRPESEIPLNEPYWKALNKHRQAFGSK